MTAAGDTQAYLCRALACEAPFDSAPALVAGLAALRQRER